MSNWIRSVRTCTVTEDRSFYKNSGINLSFLSNFDSTTGRWFDHHSVVGQMHIFQDQTAERKAKSLSLALELTKNTVRIDSELAYLEHSYFAMVSGE